MGDPDMAEQQVPDDLETADELIAERRKERPGETPDDMTPWQKPITGYIDLLNNFAGKALCLLMIPLIGVVVFEVISRNAFGIMASYDWDDIARALGLGPTMFAYDISRMIAGVLFMGAAGYGLMRGVHIRADFLYRNWSDKTQATVDAVLYMAFFIPSMLFFTVIAGIGSLLTELVKLRLIALGSLYCGQLDWLCQSVDCFLCFKGFQSYSEHFIKWARSENDIL